MIQILQETQHLHFIVSAVFVLIQTAFIDDLSLSEDEKVIMDVEIYHEAFPQDEVLRGNDTDELFVFGACDLCHRLIKIPLAHADKVHTLISDVQSFLQHAVDVGEDALQHLSGFILIHVFVDHDACQHLACLEDHLSFTQRIDIFDELLFFFIQCRDISCQLFADLFQLCDVFCGLLDAGFCLIISLLHGRELALHIDALSFDFIQSPRSLFGLLVHVFILFVARLELQLALLKLAVFDFDFLIQILHLALQFGETEEGDTDIFIHDGQHSDGEEGNQNTGNDRHDHGGVLRTEPEERHPLLTDLRSDPISQKGDQSAHGNQDQKHEYADKHSKPPLR